MKNLTKFMSIIALVAVIGFSFAALSLTGCASIPAGAEESTLEPDASNAVVYFLQPVMASNAGDIVMWDGENPVGKIKGALYMNVAYSAKPGTHYFMAERFGWSSVKVETKANNAYYIKLGWAPNPIPFANDFIILELMTQEEGLEQFKKNEQTIAFTDDWRKEFIGSLSEEDLAEMRESLNDAKK